MSTISEQVTELEKDRNELAEEVEELENQVAQMAAANLTRGPRLPRVITADELKVGQMVAIHEEDTRRVDAGVVYRVEHGGAIVRLEGAGATMFDLHRSQVDTIVLLAKAPEPTDWAAQMGRVGVVGDVAGEEPERRGEVIDEACLRAGDIYDAWTLEGAVIRDCRALLDGSTFAGLAEIRLIHRPTPELPTELGAVIEVLGVSDDANQDIRADLPLVANYSVFQGHGTWDSIDGKWNMTPAQITSWRPMRVVPAEG